MSIVHFLTQKAMRLVAKIFRYIKRIKKGINYVPIYKNSKEDVFPYLKKKVGDFRISKGKKEEESFFYSICNVVQYTRNKRTGKYQNDEELEKDLPGDLLLRLDLVMKQLI